MRDRVRKIWVPGLFTMLLAFAGQAIIFQFSALHQVVEYRGMFLVISVPWLALLGIAGAIGAYCCLHEGGTPGQRLLVAAFPALIMALILVVSLVLSFAVDANVPLRVKLTALAGYLLWETVLPAVALLAGAVPVVANEQLIYQVDNHA